jgi:hypothetical protein
VPIDGRADDGDRDAFAPPAGRCRRSGAPAPSRQSGAEPRSRIDATGFDLLVSRGPASPTFVFSLSRPS